MATETKIKGKLKAQGAVELQQQTANRVPVLDANKEVVSSAVTDTELSYVSGVTSSIQTQLNSKASQTDLDNHINDAVDAHDASAISNIPSGNLAATDLQGAVNELQSDIDTRALDSAVIKKDGSVAFTADQSMGGFKLTNVALPTAASDAATKGYVDSALEGLKPKEAVRAATTGNITLSGLQTIDGISLIAGDRVLVKDQTLAQNNGIYVVAAGAWSRSADFDSLSPIDEVNKAYTSVQEGTSHAGKSYVQTGLVTTLGTDPVNFVFFNSVSGLIGGDGITVSGSNISVDHDGEGLTFVADQLALELDGSTLSKSASGLKLADTAVTPGSFGSATEVSTFTVDQQGRLTAAGETLIAIPSTQVTDFVEAAQDAIGSTLTDTASIDLVYNDVANTISATVLPAGVDHDALANFVANEHIDHSAVQIATAAGSSGLAGGGDITTTRNLSVDINNTTALGANVDNADEVLIYDVSGSVLRKATKSQLLGGAATSPGDLAEASFSIANNQVTPANVTGFNFPTGTVRSFEALVSVEIDATTDLYEAFKITGIQKASGWDLSIIATGDDSFITFSITAGGQIQYISGAYGGFVSGLIKFRAITTTF